MIVGTDNVTPGGITSLNSANTILVEPEKLYYTAEEVLKLEKNIKDDFAAIEQKLKSSAVYWKGAAGNRLRDDFNAVAEPMESICTRFKELASNLSAIAGEYLKTQGVNVGIASGLSDDAL